MNREISFKYYFTNHAPVILSIGQIEGGAIQELIHHREAGRIKSRCQFTGMKDKNGTEIFEGDKVEYDYFYNEFEMPDGTGYWEWQRTWDVVEWDTDMFSIDGVPLGWIQDANGCQEKGEYPFPENYESGLKVIGNIHDNKNQKSDQ